MNDQTCQHCGAEFSRYEPYIRFTFFSCDAGIYDDGRKTHSFGCYERQLAAKAAEIERLKQSVLDEREACARVCDQKVDAEAKESA